MKVSAGAASSCVVTLWSCGISSTYGGKEAPVLGSCDAWADQRTSFELHALHAFSSLGWPCVSGCGVWLLLMQLNLCHCRDISLHCYGAASIPRKRYDAQNSNIERRASRCPAAVGNICHKHDRTLPAVGDVDA